MSITADLDDDLFDVQSELIPVTAKWRNIGTALRLKSDVLESIQAASGGDSPGCLVSVVTEWLKRNYNVKRFGEPTWQRLVEAVGHPAGGANMATARDIAKKHKAGGVLGRLSLCTLSNDSVSPRTNDNVAYLNSFEFLPLLVVGVVSAGLLASVTLGDNSFQVQLHFYGCLLSPNRSTPSLLHHLQPPLPSSTLPGTCCSDLLSPSPPPTSTLR